MAARDVRFLIPGHDTSDGAGVKLKRSLGQSAQARLDPFLMLDEFSSDEAADYIAGFPSHPHRGFETVTYMLDGHMLHEDHLGNRGDLKSGGVQWMTAGRGIIHSEMPQQKEGRMRGFQLWLNLPAKEKMKPAGYRDIQAEEIPEATFPGGVVVKVIAGSVTTANGPVNGPIHGPTQKISTDPQYWDISLRSGATATLPIPATHNAFVYVFEGDVMLSDGEGEDRKVPTHHAAVLGDGDSLVVRAGSRDARLLLLAGKPIGEPIVQYGPFVMNSVEEIEQALRDYRQGTLAAPA
ncbi:pirin family protein [Alcanivorax sp. JB21]|uniref:pirin family protein n=1 Tax=Alcanivorax limicola TaxID=2874102 RepID=UPI001CBAD126|nr:pirin family protein [Alcanivorax limicola]MBZ2188906.1 pirin family protein [Alcanivorax limicola]